MGRPGGDDEVRGPELRIAELVRDGHVHEGDLVHVQVKMRHPNRTGLELRDGRFVRVSPPFHLTALEVLLGDEQVSRFALTPALSDDPFITFPLLARRAGPLRVVLANSRGQRFEATHALVG